MGSLGDVLESGVLIFLLKGEALPVQWRMREPQSHVVGCHKKSNRQPLRARAGRTHKQLGVALFMSPQLQSHMPAGSPIEKTPT